MRQQTCLLCGSETERVSVGLVEWKEPIDGRRFEALPRCENRAACRERVGLLGDEWPLVETWPVGVPT